MRVRIAILGLLAFTASIALGQANDLVQATLLADTTAVQPGRPFKVGVLLKIAPQWHVYWSNPGDAGMASTVDLQLPAGFTASPWRYPVPAKIVQPGGIVSFGYENQVMLSATITPPAIVTASNVKIAATAKWLVCEKVCLPGDAKLGLTLAMKDAAEADHEDLFKLWLPQIPISLQDAGDLTADAEIAGNQLTISIDWKKPPPTQIDWFPPASDAAAFHDVRIDTRDKKTTVTCTLEFLAGQPLSSGALQSVLGYTVQNEHRGVVVPVELSASAGK